MRFTVFWSRGSQAELAREWTESSDRAALTAAAALIDRVLSQDPLDCGEARDEDFRIMFADPLGVEFHVNEPDRRVIVISVWRTKRE